MDGSTHHMGMVEEEPSVEEFRAAVVSGLRAQSKMLPCKYLYDRLGTGWFEEITRQPEYYLTAQENEILAQQGKHIANFLGESVLLMEYGSGDGSKIGHILQALPTPAGYLVVDISLTGLEQTVNRVTHQYPGLPIRAVCADYTQKWQLPSLPPHARRVIVFLGSTIGNFDPSEAIQFLRDCQAVLRPGDGLLVGVDVKKDPRVINAAYNDSRGATEAFNLNLLQRINEELEADIDVQAFRHRAFYNETVGRVEMHLQSLCEQTVHIGEEVFHFAPGETIHTENSYKYSIAQFLALAEHAGLKAKGIWTDRKNWFSLHFLTLP